MKTRLKTSVVIMLILVAAFFSRLLTLYVFDLIVGALAVMACVEIARVMERFKKYTHIAIAGSIPAVLYIAFIVLKEKQLSWEYYVVALLGIMIVYFFAVFLLTLICKKTTKAEMDKYKITDTKPSLYAYEKGFNTLFLIFYPSILFLSMIMINHLGEFASVSSIVSNSESLVLFALLLVFVVSICTDTMAFVVGCSLRGPKLCPRISPNKTISGAVGGLFGGVVSALLLYLIFTTNDSFLIAFSTIGGSVWHIVLLGVLGSVLTQFGDLFASALKRHARVKDYGTIFPGHGGVMDRYDGMIFNAFLVFVVFMILI